MKVVEQHTSPDGSLKFIVEDYGGDTALGFEGIPWHTHPECLPPYQNGNPSKTIRQFIDLLLADQQVIGLRKIDGKLIDIWVTDEPRVDDYKPNNEEIEFRYWSGKLWSGKLERAFKLLTERPRKMGGTGDPPVPVGDSPTGTATRTATFELIVRNGGAFPFRPAGRRTVQASGLCYPGLF